MTEIVLLVGAQADLIGLCARHGENAYQRIDQELELIRKMPEIAPIFAGRFRRRVVSGMPFGIFYSSLGSRVIVSAVLDLRQDPATVFRRLGIES